WKLHGCKRRLNPTNFTFFLHPHNVRRPGKSSNLRMLSRARISKTLFTALLCSFLPGKADNAPPQAAYVDASHGTVLLNVEGKQYVVDVAAGTVRPATGGAQAGS